MEWGTSSPPLSPPRFPACLPAPGSQTTSEIYPLCLHTIPSLGGKGTVQQGKLRHGMVPPSHPTPERKPHAGIDEEKQEGALLVLCTSQT